MVEIAIRRLKSFVKILPFAFAFIGSIVSAQPITLPTPYTSTVNSSSTGFAISNNGAGNGLYGYSSTGNGVVASSNSTTNSGIFAVNNSSGYGVTGSTVSGLAGIYGNGAHNGVWGRTSSGTDAGVFGQSDATISSPPACGVLGLSYTNGVCGITQTYAGHSASGVYGATTSATDNFSARGVEGRANNGIGVYGSSSQYVGVWGSVPNSGGPFIGVRGDGAAPHVPGAFFGAGVFNGDVYATGNIYKNIVSFIIDHPLDPENKFLVHSCIESPETQNLYNGILDLDENGEGTVQLPSYFEALNDEFRYQLTCIGGYAPVFVAKPVKDNAFQIAGGTPGLKVSWQVTGIRRDAAALAHPAPSEVEKSESQRGKYINPAAFGLSEEKGLLYVPEMEHKEVPVPAGAALPLK